MQKSIIEKESIDILRVKGLIQTKQLLTQFFMMDTIMVT